ncbi:hypothetical protein MTP99_007355 [Tenebrio molitor]|nr:hypothetical protein MTP99_007355 [Tenebrio molitor]
MVGPRLYGRDDKGHSSPKSSRVITESSVFTPQYLPPSFRTHPHRTNPEFLVSVGEKAMESLSSPPSLGGIKDGCVLLCSPCFCVFISCYPVGGRAFKKTRPVHCEGGPCVKT